MVLEDLEDSVEVEVVLADIPALDPSSVLIQAAYVSTALSILPVGPSFAVASSFAVAATAVAFCAPSWVAHALACFSRRFCCAGPFLAPRAFCWWVC